MIKRLEHEPDEAFISRLQKMITKALVKIDTMNKQLKDSGITNMRTGKKYKDEANSMFMSLALIDMLLREDSSEENLEKVTAIIRGILQELGFSLIDLYENKALKDGTYFGE